jgi:hypothetical protein
MGRMPPARIDKLSELRMIRRRLSTTGPLAGSSRVVAESGRAPADRSSVGCPAGFAQELGPASW